MSDIRFDVKSAESRDKYHNLQYPDYLELNMTFDEGWNLLRALVERLNRKEPERPQGGISLTFGGKVEGR